MVSFSKGQTKQKKPARRKTMIKIFTDSAANIPKAICDELQISVVPFYYNMDGKEVCCEDEEFDGKKFYDALRAGSVVKTSMINETLFAERFEDALDKGFDVLYIGMSGGVSGTFFAASSAARDLRERYPYRKIETVNTRGASLGEGLIVIEAAKRLLENNDFDELAEYVKELCEGLCQYFTVEDLRHLRRSGRISGAAAVVGSLLGICPILKGNENGEIVLSDKVRGRKRALAYLAERWEKLGGKKDGLIAIAHSDNDEGCEYLLSKLRGKGFCGKCITACYEPVTGSHVGPGTVALFFFK